ncbi:MAG: efflux RND transporter periplasmic adaptor subunit [Ignavibacteriaceae bacterium]
MKKRITIISFAAVIVFLILVKILFYSDSEGDNSPRSRNIEKVVPADLLILKSSAFSRKIVTNGSVLAAEEVELRPEISGRITGIFFKEGEYCSKGKLLVKINDAELQAQLRKADAKRKILEDREYRQRMLLEKKATAQEVYDAALNDLQSILSDIELLHAQIDKTEIKAPFNGVVGIRYVSEGGIVNSSSKIALFQQIDKIKIDFSIPGKYFNSIKKGDRISYTISGNNTKYSAVIAAIEQKLDQTSRTVTIRSVGENRNRVIPAGAFASVEITLNESVKTFSIPADAILADVKGNIVWLYRNGLAVPEFVEILDRDVSNVRISAGLNEGDTVIVSSLIRLRPGVNIKVTKIN